MDAKTFQRHVDTIYAANKDKSYAELMTYAKQVQNTQLLNNMKLGIARGLIHHKYPKQSERAIQTLDEHQDELLHHLNLRETD